MPTCEECGANEATVHLTYISNESTKVSRLCADCAKKKGISVSIDDESVKDETNTPVALPEKDVLCPACNTLLSEFRENGRLGCPQCYRNFEKEIDAMLMQANGTLAHKGKRYTGNSVCQADVKDIDSLRNELAEAVKNEEFELAADIRDEIHSLTDGSGTETKAGENA
jgi:protein arginine kinase activator